LRLEVTGRARQEADDVRKWYRRRSRQAAKDFSLELRATMGRIRSNPMQYQVSDFDNRHARVHRFPYLVVFHVQEPRVVVTAVIHAHRDPSSYAHR
jgi:plasmid stabilization system protein ParE